MRRNHRTIVLSHDIFGFHAGLVVDTPQSIDEVWSMIRNQFALMDRNLIVQMLKHLAQDHYLISDTDKRYSFRFPLVKRWWKIAQGLHS